MARPKRSPQLSADISHLSLQGPDERPLAVGFLCDRKPRERMTIAALLKQLEFLDLIRSPLTIAATTSACFPLEADRVLPEESHPSPSG